MIKHEMVRIDAGVRKESKDKDSHGLHIFDAGGAKRARRFELVLEIGALCYSL